MLRIFIAEAGPGKKFEEIPNGPFPITREELNAARHQYTDALADGGFGGVQQVPATTARSILIRLKPTLSVFDVNMLSYAVLADKVKIKPED